MPPSLREKNLKKKLINQEFKKIGKEDEQKDER